jgi:hypothetical protein
VLSVPADGSDKQSTYPLFTWSKDTIGTLFDLEIATDINFTEIIATAEVSENEYTQNKELRKHSQYFWRVRSKNGWLRCV